MTLRTVPTMLAVTLGCAALTACGAHGTGGIARGPGVHRPGTTSPGTTSPGTTSPGTPLRPSVPALFRTGVNECGDPYAINATSRTADGTGRTVPLLDCPGLAGLDPLPVVRVDVGGQVLISGVPRNASLTLTPSTLLTPSTPSTRAGTTFTAVRAGRTEITIHHVLCVPSDGTQARTCGLLEVVAR